MDAMADTPNTLSASKPIVGAGNLTGPVRLLNAGLDERGDEVVAHGWLDIDSLGALKIGTYQREVLSRVAGGKKTSLQRALEENSRLPDIMLGMRGSNFDTKGHTMILTAPVYIIDGLQRVSALKQYAEANPAAAKNLRIGAEVRFSTNQAIEEELFIVLNTSRIPVSPNIILRNLRSKHASIATLHGLSVSDREFPLFERVTWGQRMNRGEMVTALMMCKVAQALHAFDGTGGRVERAPKMAVILDNFAKRVTLPVFRANIKTFFEVIDSCWPFSHIEYREKAVCLKGNFLFSMAQLFCQHTDFWKPGTDRLVVDAAARRKIATFPVNDPEVGRLASAGTMALPLLYDLLTKHFDHGKRVGGRLHKRSENR